jgi:hypothetical protein
MNRPALLQALLSTVARVPLYVLLLANLMLIALLLWLAGFE